MRKLLLIAVFVVIGTSMLVHAGTIGACRADTVTAFIGTSCTIGDKTFAFGTDTFDFEVITGNPHPGTLSSTPISTDNLTLTPDASNPNSPGFILSGTKGFALATTGGDPGTEILLHWDYSVSITDPSSGFVIIGSTVKTIGATANGTDPVNEEVGAGATNFLQFSTSCFSFPGAGVSLGPIPSNSTSATDNPACATPATSITTASLQLSVGAIDGSASLTSAGYYVNEEKAAATTPEPSSFVLCTVALGAFLFSRRKVTPLALTLHGH